MAKTKEGGLIDLHVRHKGAPIVNHGFLLRNTPKLVALEIDLKSKYCEVVCTTGGDGEAPGLHIGATNRSLNLNKKVKRDEPTAIDFKGYDGWDIFAADIFSYTLRV